MTGRKPSRNRLPDAPFPRTGCARSGRPLWWSPDILWVRHAGLGSPPGQLAAPAARVAFLLAGGGAALLWQRIGVSGPVALARAEPGQLRIGHLPASSPSRRTTAAGVLRAAAFWRTRPFPARRSLRRDDDRRDPGVRRPLYVDVPAEAALTGALATGFAALPGCRCLYARTAAPAAAGLQPGSRPA
jgi:hypothetical protein